MTNITSEFGLKVSLRVTELTFCNFVSQRFKSISLGQHSTVDEKDYDEKDEIQLRRSWLSLDAKEKETERLKSWAIWIQYMILIIFCSKVNIDKSVLHIKILIIWIQYMILNILCSKVNIDIAH